MKTLSGLRPHAIDVIAEAQARSTIGFDLKHKVRVIRRIAQQVGLGRPSRLCRSACW